MSKEFHSDTNDKALTINCILPKIIKNYVETLEPQYKYHKIDLYAITTKYDDDLIPIEVKNKMDYHVNDFKTLSIDTHTFNDLKENGYLITWYPADKKILIYDNEQLKNAFRENKIQYVTSYSEKYKKWYKEEKLLTHIYINKGTLYDYNDFNIPQEIIYKLKEDINENK